MSTTGRTQDTYESVTRTPRTSTTIGTTGLRRKGTHSPAVSQGPGSRLERPLMPVLPHVDPGPSTCSGPPPPNVKDPNGPRNPLVVDPGLPV